MMMKMMMMLIFKWLILITHVIGLEINLAFAL